MTTRLTRWLTALDNFEAKNSVVAGGASLRTFNPRHRSGTGGHWSPASAGRNLHY
ncbi:Uncharacterised protein [Salmonella enterica subsp. arizonae]|uniref:Uncharacterized protein n=1 Tax=Salmonella enterica subsp. arizonae TaxID=59203 RepID=A0A379SLH8_SALER|nr:Uncharacterised protein [Salmonella enterica subsp. arizonae]